MKIDRSNARHAAAVSLRPGGFTLVELLVVVALLALLTGLASYWVRKPMDQARERLFVEQLLSLDRTLRNRVDHRGGSLILDFQNSHAEALLGHEGGSMQRFRVINIPRSFAPENVIGFQSAGPNVFRLRYDRYGTTASYQWQFSQRKRTIAVAGLTGEWTELATADEQETLPQ